jgi:hypothetical protein
VGSAFVGFAAVLPIALAVEYAKLGESAWGKQDTAIVVFVGLQLA